MIQSDRSAPHWRLALALGAMSLLYVVFALTVPSSAQAGTPYCGIWVPANTDCANVAGGKLGKRLLQSKPRGIRWRVPGL